MVVKKFRTFVTSCGFHQLTSALNYGHFDNEI
jgi:hypothetical protein